jgi:hypothetical protein
VRAERALLRTGEYLVGRACRRLAPATRDQRYREWTAELPAILHDPQIMLASHRAVRMLGYAADTLRGTALTPGPARRRPAAILTPILGLLFVAGLVVVAWAVWDTVRAPGNWVNYLRVAWSLFLVAFPVSQYVRSNMRMTVLILISSCLVGVVVCIGDAVQAPWDWVNYLLAGTSLLVLLLAVLSWWLIRRLGRPTARISPDT